LRHVGFQKRWTPAVDPKEPVMIGSFAASKICREPSALMGRRQRPRA